MTSIDFVAEEVTEAEKHDVVYSETRDLRLKPSAWERFHTMTERQAFHPYTWIMWRVAKKLPGAHVLDAGCGDGWLSPILAKLGATVDAFDISPKGIEVARERARVNGVADRCDFRVASFYAMPYADATYSLVIGVSILHHLGDKAQVAKDLFRVMKPGGVAFFEEPFGNALWLERLRLFVPVPSGAPEDPGEWERQFKYSDLIPFRDVGFEISLKEMQMFSRIDRVIGADNWFIRAVYRFDRWLLNHVPSLRPYARDIAIELRKPNHGRAQ